MPALVRLYIKNVIIGFALSAAFVAALLALNVGNLWHLVSATQGGWIAAVMLFVFNGIVFAGVQFAIVIMRMADKGGQGGTRRPVGRVGALAPVPAKAKVRAQDMEHR